MIAKKIALGFGLAVVFPLLIHYGVSTFVPQPDWRDDPFSSVAGKSSKYRTEERIFEKHLFAVAVPLGLAALLVGAFIRLPAMGAGLMFGGIFSVSDGYFNYWSELPDALKCGSLLVAFVLLIFLAYRRLEHETPPNASSGRNLVT